MQDNGNGNGVFYGKDKLKEVGAWLVAGDLSRHIAQCLYNDCRTYWYYGGEWKTRETVRRDGTFYKLKRAIRVLNRIEPVSPDDTRAVKGLEHISHGFCRLCLRKKKQDLVRRQQQKDGFNDCFARVESCECEWENHPDPLWRCSHPCTIHHGREEERKKRMEGIRNLREDRQNSQA